MVMFSSCFICKIIQGIPYRDHFGTISSGQGNCIDAERFVSSHTGSYSGWYIIDSPLPVLTATESGKPGMVMMFPSPPVDAMQIYLSFRYQCYWYRCDPYPTTTCKRISIIIEFPVCHQNYRTDCIRIGIGIYYSYPLLPV